MQRLKNKLGTRQLPTAELLLDGTKAYLVQTYLLIVIICVQGTTVHMSYNDSNFVISTVPINIHKATVAFCIIMLTGTVLITMRKMFLLHFPHQNLLPHEFGQQLQVERMRQSLWCLQ